MANSTASTTASTRFSVFPTFAPAAVAPAEVATYQVDPAHTTVCFHATTEIDRRDFGIDGGASSRAGFRPSATRSSSSSTSRP